MKGTGSVTFGSFIAGGVGAEITLEDGSKWTFAGFVIGLTIGGAVVYDVEGDFPGAGRIGGLSTISIVGAAVGAGSFQIEWGDFEGRIGLVNGDAMGADITVAGGAGEWTKG